MALKLIGTAFIALAIYVLGQSAWTLLANAYPAPSPLGIVWSGDMRCHAAVGVGEIDHRPSAWQFGAYHGGRVTLIDAALAGAVLNPDVLPKVNPPATLRSFWLEVGMALKDWDEVSFSISRSKSARTIWKWLYFCSPA